MKKLTTNKLRVTIYQKLMAFASALQNIPAKITPPPFRLMQIGSLFWQSRALYTATKLGIADVIADAEKSTVEIAAELNLHEDHLYRLLRMLGSIGVFNEISPRTFRNCKTSAFLREDNPKNVRAMILMHNSQEMTAPWMQPLEESLHDGSVPFVKVHGADLFSYMDLNNSFDLLFSQAMDSVESLTGNGFLDDFNWGAFDRIIDVGGSKGSKSISLLRSFPKLNAVVFDRPQIINTAKTYWTDKISAEILCRVEFQPGDMFDVLPQATSDNNLYVFFAIFHALNDKDAKKVLGNLKSAIGTRNPYILIVDSVAEEMQINPTTASFDMQMLIGTRGRERTLGEWKQLLNDSGYTILEIIDVRTFAKFIVIKPS